MSRRIQKTKESRTSGISTSENKLEGVLKVSLVVLLLSRFFVPAENASDGETLLWVFLTFGIFTLWVWSGMKAGTLEFSLTRFDLAFLVIVLAHLISGLTVLFSEGQKRAALNMVWEWLGLGVSIFLLRQYTTEARFYKQFLLAVVSVVVALACLGMYQHFVWYPQQGKEYQALREELDRLLEKKQSLTSPKIETRIRKIQSDFSVQNIPLEGPARKRFEDRLLSSSEPFAMFALANTFAGFLVLGWLVVFGNLATRKWKNASSSEFITSLLVLLLIGACLFLTQCRTAWIGTFCGAMMMTWITFRRKFFSEKFVKLVGFGVMVLIGIGVLVMSAVLFSDLNSKVVKETPRSLRFRFQYWQSTLATIGEFPVWGTGPGNFRQHYLKHKLPESSEEIADPHNFFFDLWANAGVLAAMGILAAIYFAIRSAMHSFKQVDLDKVASNHDRNKVTPFPFVFIGLVLSLIVFLWVSDFDLSINLGFCAMAVAVYSILSRFPMDRLGSPVVLSGCSLAMLVHLLGQGGIEMPTVVLVFLIFSLGFTKETNSQNDFHFELQSGKRIFIMLVVSFLLMLGCFFSGFSPTFYSNSLMKLARSENLVGNIEAAERDLRDAAKADPLSPKPWIDLSTLVHRQSLSGDSQNEKFAEAVELQKQAIARNPQSWQGYRLLGIWFGERYRRFGKKELSDLAVENFEEAIIRYPTHSQLRAEFAFLLNDAKRFEEAREQARETLLLHAINRHEEHTDKYLSDDQLAKLTKIVEE